MPTPDPAAERRHWREKLIAAREGLSDRDARAEELQSILRAWLIGERVATIGAYWPINGEFDPLPALYRWSEAGDEDEERFIGLPVVDRATRSLQFHLWFPGCPMEPDAYDIPKPKGTPVFEPELLVLPCLGYGPGGVRMGYGGGFYDRTVAELSPRPTIVGVGYSIGFLPLLRARPGDLQLDAMLTEDGVMWQRP